MNEEAIFRSAPMSLVQFYVTNELARDVVYALGRLGNVHFRDLNSKLTPFQRTFLNELRGIDVIESQLTFLETTMTKHHTIKGYIYQNLQADTAPFSSLSEMDDLATKVADFYERIKHLDDAYNHLSSQRSRLLQNRHVLTVVNEFQNTALIVNDNDGQLRGSLDGDSDNVALLNHREPSLELGLETAEINDSFNAIAGAISREKVPLLRQILWRALRGNLYFYDAPIDADEEVNVFLIYLHGDMLKQKVKRIVQSLDGTLYDNVYGTTEARLATLDELNEKVQDLDTVVASTKNHLIAELMILQESFTDWVYCIRRERNIYNTLNKFDMDGTRRCLVGEGWIPRAEFQKVRTTLRSLIRSKMQSSGAILGSQEEISLENGETVAPTVANTLFAIDDTVNDVQSLDSDDDQYNQLVAVVNELATNRTPPTYHKTNKFTSAFQSIVDAYGVATYQEVNPSLATVITFPFMFAIMFGDIGHGIILALIALYLVKNEKRFGDMRNKDEVFDMAFSGRYVLLLMGLFSVYTGFLYNDIFSKSMTLFKPGWKFEFPKNYDYSKDGAITLSASRVSGYVYPFGLDWSWHGTDNNLLFTNSYKMKLSVLMGFIHMNYSLFFSLVNYRFFKSKVDIIGNFIPGVLFMQSIFGYLSLAIIYKWSVDWIKIDKPPPGLLNMLINMFLAPGKIEDQLYPGQAFVQVVLVLIALVCVPWLLLYKPLTLRNQNKNAVELGYKDLHSQELHTIQLQEEAAALSFELDADDDDLNHDPEDVDVFGDNYRFPNDIEPLYNNAAAHGDDGEHFDLGDVVIHQVIHTIEFCLNCVSHTASYLRLWALSLAHAQLSSVLWSMTISKAFSMTGGIGVVMTVFLFGFWFVLTVCILVLMEGTSAMLHSLRLHWVEAMSKFFEGEGYAYEPFALDSLM
ncbi:H(+)-transporting V0 sector ATPase subunit a [Yamadazyma tenuis]|nr:H(+)-transporting V0 sector ATPase subunit a [Yamadazyma tenuis]